MVSTDKLHWFWPDPPPPHTIFFKLIPPAGPLCPPPPPPCGLCPSKLFLNLPLGINKDHDTIKSSIHRLTKMSAKKYTDGNLRCEIKFLGHLTQCAPLPSVPSGV